MTRGLGVFKRVLRDYGADNRGHRYGQVLAHALEAGYEILTVMEFHRRVIGGDDLARCLVVRHDIDTDPDGALRFLEHEQRLGVRATYYFRHTTAPQRVVRSVAQSGADIGYHFEEPATFAKRLGIAEFDELKSHRSDIEQEFLANLATLRKSAGQVSHASSHGDFANRRLGFSNSWLLDSPTLRQAAGVEFETYDRVLVDAVDLRVSDGLRAEGAAEAVSSGVRALNGPIYFLSHPREWFVHRRATAAADLDRVRAELSWRIARRAA